MIAVTRLNGEQITLNAMQIETVEPGADTRVALVSGKQLYVRESCEEVGELVRAWYHAVFTGQPVEHSSMGERT